VLSGKETVVAVYVVYEPPNPPPDLAERAERLAFVKEGFSWPALFVPLLWLLYHRMWIEFGLLLALYFALQLAFGADTQGQTLAAWASLGIGVLFAFEANDIRAAALERKGFKLAGIASGRGRSDAELSFFRAWLSREASGARPERSQEPRRAIEAQPQAARGEGEEVIGLFPQP
jgi:hypothetical protein